MATWYVRSGATGNGTGPGLAQAWGTLTQAVAAASGVTGGDTIWIAPGVYRETPTVGFTNPTSTVNFFGDPTASQFPGVSPAPVRVTGFTISDNSTTSTGLSFTSSRDYTYFRDIVFVCGMTLTGSNLTMYRCVFESAPVSISPTATTNANITIDSCTSLSSGFTFTFPKAAANYNPNAVVKNCSIFMTNATTIGIRFQTTGSGVGWITDALVTNCTIIGGARCVDIAFASGLTGRAVLLQNSIVSANAFTLVSDVGGQLQYQNCRISGSISGPSGISGNTTTMSYLGIEFGQSKLGGIPNPQLLSNIVGSVNLGWGTATNAPIVDLYGNAWTTASPDAGSGAYASIGSTSFYFPTERNASAITIAPGSTSQSIELYLGATGLTASTSGLSARYNRTRTASVSIPLVARTIAQAWTSGGFAEVDSIYMPGVYRLDLPDDALLAGADDVTIVVRGASGTNGAVMTVKLSSGGLTSAQTASAVWGASPAGYNDATTFGGVVNQIDTTVTGISTAVQDVAGDVWDELRTNHTTAGSFGQSVNAELVTPVTSAALVRMGPFEVKADGLGASDPLDIQKGAQHGVDIQCVDGNGNGIDITSATVTAKVYNSGGTLVDTYACTATYAADGRATFAIDTTVTNTVGTYTATVTRTTGASDTQVFGPLRIYVRDI